MLDKYKRIFHSNLWRAGFGIDRADIVTILIYFLLLAAISVKQGSLVLLSIPLVLLAGSTKLFSVKSPNLSVSREQDVYRAFSGESINIRMKIQNNGASINELKIRDIIPRGLEKTEGFTSVLTPIASGSSIVLNYDLKGCCGTFELPGIEITQRDFLGLTTQSRVIEVPAKIFILPKATSKKGLILRPHRTRPQSGLNLSQQGGEGIELFGVREYRPGDPLRYINGRASARHPKSLFIQEFEREKVATVFLVLDTQGQTLSGSTGDNLLSHTLNSTALLSEALLNSGNRVGLYIFGNYNNWVFPGSGKVQKERILRALALKAESHSTWNSKLADLPTRLLTPRSLLIMISPLLGSEPWMLQALKGRRYQVLVVSPDEIDFEEKKGGESRATHLALRLAGLERSIMTRELNESSIPVLNWQIDTPFEFIIRKFLGTYWR